MPEAKTDRFQLFADGVKDYAFIQFDPDNRVTDWNAGAERLLGFTEAEILGQPGAVFFVPEDREQNVPEQEMANALQHGTAEDERWHMRKDGARFRASGVLTRLCDEQGKTIGFAKVLRSLTEKDALLREIHHRVKNNLQVIISLLALQSRYVQDPTALASMEATTNRVLAIARIHEALYGTADLASVPFASYLRQLVNDLAMFYDVTQRVRTSVETPPLTLDIERALPLALITNELICNAMKHAFIDRNAGAIDVSVTPGGSSAELAVTDNGVGLRPGFDPEVDGGMGFNLIHILKEQLQADVRIESDRGTRISVHFPLSS